MCANEKLDQLVACLRAGQAAGKTKAACVRACAGCHPTLGRAEAIAAYREALCMREGQASTYFYLYHTPAERESEKPSATIAEPERFEVSTSVLRESLREATEQAAQWYLERTRPIARKRFLSHGGIADDGHGSIYSYHDAHSTLYVGITGHRVKSRLNTPTSPHSRKPWWTLWDQMRFLALPNRAERETLEHLLILGLAAGWNRKPGALDIDSFLDRY